MDPQKQAELDSILGELMVEQQTDDVEVQEQTDWLKMADFICHDSWRNRV